MYLKQVGAAIVLETVFQVAFKQQVATPVGIASTGDRLKVYSQVPMFRIVCLEILSGIYGP